MYDEPIRHPIATRKTTTWHVSIQKPIVFLGDSNLSKIPTFQGPKVQMHSYPGAQLDHITEIIRKMDGPNHQPEKIILAVGLNNGLTRNREPTLRKCIQKLLKVTTDTFPCALVYVLLLNF